jgi:hypothetical protein
MTALEPPATIRLVEVVDPADSSKHRHRGLGWLGLQEPPPEAGAWVPVARAFVSSKDASRLVERLAAAGIDGRLRSYSFDNTQPSAIGAGWSGEVEERMAVLVHDRDRRRATEIARELEREQHDLAQRTVVSDEELTREALDAGPAPEI